VNAKPDRTNNKKPWLKRISIGLFVLLVAALSVWVIVQLWTTGFTQTKTRIIESKPIIILIAIIATLAAITSWSVKIDKAIGVFKKYFINAEGAAPNGPNDDREEQRKDQLLQAVIDGKITAKEAKDLANIFTTDAYPKGIENSVDNGQSSEGFKKSVVKIARSDDNERRQALALIADETTRTEGLTQLQMIAQSASHDLAQQWRELAELAYPFDTQISTISYEQVIKYSPADTWAHIYLSRLYVRNSNLPAAKKTLSETLDATPSKRDKSVIFDELGDIATAQTDLPAARAYYEDGLKIAKALAQSDPTHGGYQRDLAFVYAKLALLGEDDAKKQWKRAHGILKSLDEAGRLAPTDQGALKHSASMIEG